MNSNSHGARRLCQRPDLRTAAAAVLLLGAASNASAFFDDRLQVFVGETVTREDNIFRLANGSADTYYGTTVGFNLDTTVSRQRIQAGADWTDVRYHRYTDLDHLEHNARVNWLWQAGDRWNGTLGYTESKALASFINFTGSTTPNPLTTRVASGSANFLVTPRWQLQAIGSGMRQRNELSSRQVEDVDVNTLQLGVNYLSPAGNSVGVDVREEDGRYPNQQSAGGIFFGSDYVQRGIGAIGDWHVTAKSHLSGRVDYIRRDYDQFSSRDYSGGTFRLAYDWQATAKSALNVTAQRDISATEDLQTSFILVKGISITPSHAFSEKLRMSATLSSSIRDYLGDPGVAPAGPNVFGGRVDHLQAASLSLSYFPLRSVSVILSAQHERRTSNTPGADYTANVVGLNARLTF
jgi:exopolysaccharide biosynthesis operon protein EpsL